MATSSILTTPLTQLNISPEFRAMAETNNFNTLQDILNYPTHKLHTLPESGYRIVRELMNLLEEHGLSHLVR